jgi:hypothetical protein
VAAPAAARSAVAPAPRAAIDETPSAGGLGSLVARRASGAAEQLHLRQLNVTASLAGDQAETQVEHIFRNPTDERMEGTFRFPLPDGALLVGLAMEIEGKLMEGELVESDKARRIYESIVEEMRDPALLEWEHGNVFKLRVFPIEPRAEKRIVLRYLSPLQQTSAGAWRYRYATAAPELQGKIDRFRLAVAGRLVVDEARFTPGREVSVPLTAAPAAVLREARKDATYTAVRVTPDWSQLGAAARLETRRGAHRRLLVLVDTSRSSLESRSLALQATQQLLEELQPGDQMLVAAADIACRDHAPGFVPASPQTIRDALAFLRAIEPDGASDLGAALRHAGARLRAHDVASAQVVYVGDGTPTWGETDETALRELARRSLGGAPLFAVVLGRGASTELATALAGELGGRVLRPREPAEVRRFAGLLRAARELPVLRGVKLASGADDAVFPRLPTSLFPGDSLVALIRTRAGKQSPTHV